jgi:hypothetical protein
MVYFDARERVARADTHLKAGIELWDRFMEDEPYGVSVNVEPDGTGEIHVIPRYDTLPTAFSIEFGEMLYQLRATLDTLVYQAAIYDTGQAPPPDHERLEFPFRSSREEFDNATWKIRPLSPKHRDIIESVQPYNAPHVSPDERTTINGLTALNDWARIDRHRRLHIISSWATRARPKFQCPHGVTVRSIVVASEPGHFLEDESKVAGFFVEGWDPSMSFQANPDLFIDVTIQEASPLGVGPTLTDASNAVIQAVQVVLKRFESI